MRVEIPNQISVKIGGIISRGVKAVEVSDEGKLIFTLTDGSTVNLGSVIGPEGPKGETGPAGPTGPAGAKGDTGAAGASILSIEKTSQSGTTSTYTITMSDGQTFDFEVQADKGDKGDKGDTGATGPKGPQGEQGPAGIVVQETEPTGPEHPVWVNPKGGASDPGITGKDGTTFTPSVSASGDLRWTNDGGKENPETVNIKGPQGKPGEKGDTGSPGAKGDPGATPNLQIGTVETLPAGSDATASMGGTAENPLLNLGIPKGADGSGGSSSITTATETDIAGLLMGEGGKVRKAVPDEDYLKTKELPTPVPSNDSGKYLRWFNGAGWHLESLDLYTCNMVDVNGQYYCDQSLSDIQALVTAGKTIFAMSNGEPYLLTSLSAQAAVFTRVAGTTVTTVTVSSDYTAALTTTELQPAGSSGGTDLSLGMTGAAVGQIAKITEVDANGKPTAWEPADMASGSSGEVWEKVAEITLTEQVNSVRVTFSACRAVYVQFQWGGVEDNLGNIDIAPNCGETLTGVVERRVSAAFVTTSTNAKRGYTFIRIDTRVGSVWTATSSTLSRADGSFGAITPDTLMNCEIGITNNFGISMMNPRYFTIQNEPLSNGVRSITAYGAGMAIGTTLKVWGIKK